jgi:syntaxin-binding protein 1
VFIAGGATYSESRACYDISKKYNRDVILGTTDMITPTTFLRELSRARESRQNLKLTIDAVRAPPPTRQIDPVSQQRTLPPPTAQSRPPQGRMGMSPPSAPPGSLRPGPTQPSRNGAPGGPRPIPEQSRSPPRNVAHGPGHGVSHEASHRPSPSVASDGKEGDKEKKKKKKFGMF